MPKHPTVEIPNLGAMDHAWDLLGEWNVELEVVHAPLPVSGSLRVYSWSKAYLDLDPRSAAAVDLPSRVIFERVGEVHRTDAGGGALQWVLVCDSERWTAQATLWPGSLYLFVQEGGHPDRQLFTAAATRSREYYLRKYPLELGTENGGNETWGRWPGSERK